MYEVSYTATGEPYGVNGWEFTTHSELSLTISMTAEDGAVVGDGECRWLFRQTYLKLDPGAPDPAGTATEYQGDETLTVSGSITDNTVWLLSDGCDGLLESARTPYGAGLRGELRKGTVQFDLALSWDGEFRKDQWAEAPTLVGDDPWQLSLKRQ